MFCTFVYKWLNFFSLSIIKIVSYASGSLSEYHYVQQCYQIKEIIMIMNCPYIYSSVLCHSVSWLSGSDLQRGCFLQHADD